MRCPEIFFLLFLLSGLFLGCSSETMPDRLGVTDVLAGSTVDVRFGTLNPKKGMSHLTFIAPSQEGESIGFQSLQQVDAKAKKIGKDEYAVVDLIPGQHTFIVSRSTGTQTVYAVFRSIQLAADELGDLGTVPFQKPGRIQGRFLSADDSSALADVTVRLPELGLSARTNASGEFELQEIPPGQWQLSARAVDGRVLRSSRIEVSENKKSDLGDLWLGRVDFSSVTPELLNGKDGVVSEAKAQLRLNLPQGARFVSVRTSEGETLLAQTPAKRILTVPFQQSGSHTLQIFVLDDVLKTMGVLQQHVFFDPFSVNGHPYVPEIRAQQRVVVSPARTFSFELLNIPVSASSVRFSIDGDAGRWQSPQQTVSLSLPKSNASCGQRLVSIEFKNDQQISSLPFAFPITLSCWQRIPHRAAIDKIVGIENAAAWTGTHAFVWSGKQFNFTNRAAVWGGSNSAETVADQEELHTYKYFDGGYIYQPIVDPTTQQLGRAKMEFIVTDFAPAPRAFAGTGGRGNLVAVYGGENEKGPLADGGVFDIANNGWFSMSGPGAPSPRVKPSVYFISETEVLVWGGTAKTELGYEIPLNDGAIYDVTSHRWRPVSNTNAPSARMGYVGVWTGSEFFVLGGHLPGVREVYTAAKFNPQTNTWTSLPDFPANYPLSFMSGVHTGNYVLLYGRNQAGLVYDITRNAIAQSFSLNLLNWNMNPTLVLDGDGTGPQGSLLYIFGGRATNNTSDVNSGVITLNFKDGEFDFSSPRFKVFETIFSAATISSKPIAKCCTNFLGFSFAGKIFAINGTERSNTAVRVVITTSAPDGGGANNYSKTFYQLQSYNSRTLTLNETSNSMSSALIDLPADHGAGPSTPQGPYYLYQTSLPAWSSKFRKLIWYGGIFLNPLDRYYLNGGFALDVDSLTWQRIPVATSEPISYTHSSYGNQYYSRFDAFNFFLSDTFFQLGGYRYDGGKHDLFDGFKSSFSGTSFAAPQAILPANLPTFDFVPIDTSVSESSRWNNNPPCIAGDFALLSGGRRRSVRSVSEFEETKALVQHKVVFDGTLGQMRRAADGPLGVRAGATVVSTGGDCLLWGGYTADDAVYSSDSATLTSRLISHSRFKSDGAIYSFANDAWKSMSSTGAPPARAFMYGVWTGTEVLFWGGSEHYFPSVSKNLQAEKGTWLYNPTTDRWRALPAAPNEPNYNADERPVWTGRHMFIFKAVDSEYSFQFTPETNTWIRIPMPFGLGYRTNAYWDTEVVWTGNKLFVKPNTQDGMALMAFFVPPDP